MESLAFSLSATLPVFLTMLLGVLFRRVGLISASLADGLNTFVFKVALPCLLFLDVAGQDFAAGWDGGYVLFCLVATAFSIAVAALLARLVVSDRGRRGEFVQVSYRSSAAILGLAFIRNIYGEAGTGMAALMILGSVPLYNVAAVVILTLTGSDAGSVASETKGRHGRSLAWRAIRGVVTNPIILGIAAGFVWSVLRVPMPQLLSDTLENLAVLATPLGLMAMGASIRLEAVREELPAALVASALKLVGFVAAFLPLAVALGYTNERLVSLLVMLGSASTVSCYVMARNLGHEGSLTATTVALTTFGCAFTLTAWLALVRSMGLV